MPPVESHLATVIDSAADPEKMFAISVQIDSLLPGEIYPELAQPLFPPNFMKIPKSGQIVECVILAPEINSSELGEAGEDGLGPEEFADFIYWTGRIFDLKEGNVPSELKTHYPKRTGWWTDNGSIIYMDDTKGSLEIALVLQGGNNYIRIKENQIEIQLGSTIYVKLSNDRIELVKGVQKVVLENDRVHIDATRVNLGSDAPAAADALLKGTTFTNPLLPGSMAKFLTDWAAGTLTLQQDLTNLINNPPVDPTQLAQTIKTYTDTLVGAQTAVLAGIVTWISTKIFLDT